VFHLVPNVGPGAIRGNHKQLAIAVAFEVPISSSQEQ